MPDIATFPLLLCQQKFLISVTYNANSNFIIENLLSLLGIENYSRHISCGTRRLFSIRFIKQHIKVSFLHMLLINAVQASR
jgi:hypothetical protein